MRLLSYSHHGRSTFGAVVDDGVIDLGQRLDGVRDLSDLLRQERVDDARAAIDGTEPDLALADIVYERTLPSPG